MKLPFFTEVEGEESKPDDEKPVSSRSFFSQVAVTPTTDDATLLEVHVGNPLKRITELLQQIKKQKAFSFTLKGSLGIMGVALTLSMFGIFGGTKAFCDKGIQSHIGTVKYLSSSHPDKSDMLLIGPVIDYYKNFFSPPGSITYRHRIVLVTSDLQTIRLPYTQGVDYSAFQNQSVIITGQYDSCTRALKPERGEDVETYE